MEEESVDFVRTNHPLPDAIQSMTLEDTVCKYCGISYLIHREVAKLKDEVARLTGELDKTEAERQGFNNFYA
ncbi:unnamed protein product [Oikopleura dioica]|uniref:Uncharacterized protein n=1 Tax=Oikopleura dioica TaxID=34765 RepID=E4Z010_OIKDI|nr:unnamed protein product [Oikopleura dioica]